MMNKRLTVLIAACLLGASISADPVDVPEQLTTQIDRLCALISDGYAVGYPAATMHQVLNPGRPDALVLAVFSVEGFGGRNGFVQYLAAFEENTDRNDEDYFSLIDVIPIGGKGWRQVETLNAKPIAISEKRVRSFVLEVMENTDADALNFPSRPSTVTLSLRGATLSEVRAP